MNRPVLRLLAGSFVSLQDAGRFGHARHGVGSAGPMDPLARLLAARLGTAAGTDVDRTPVIEVGPDGARLRAEDGPVIVAAAGPGATVTLGHDTITSPAVVRLEVDDEIAVAGARWSYLCPVGEVLARRTLGSVSWHGRTALGVGLDPGDVLAVGPQSMSGQAPAGRASGEDRRRRAPTDGPRLGERLAPPTVDDALLLLPAPQTHLFDVDARAALVDGSAVVAPVGDRMAQRVDGVRIHAAGGHDIVSDGIVAGAVQVQGDGAPWVLGPEHQPTGGYPKVAVLAAADRGRFAQLGPGSTVRWCWGTVAEARTRWAEAVAAIERSVAGPVMPTPDRLRAAPVEGAGTGFAGDPLA